MKTDDMKDTGLPVPGGAVGGLLERLAAFEEIEMLKDQRRVSAEIVRLALEWKAKQDKE